MLRDRIFFAAKGSSFLFCCPVLRLRRVPALPGNCLMPLAAVQLSCKSPRLPTQAIVS